jgi:ribosomal protein S15P/S13E
MTKKCLDIGTIQAFLDGELAFEQSETVAHHVAACDDCAIMLAVAEEESSFAFDALEQEFNALVPTQRLWTKINDSIELQKEKKSFWTPIYAFFRQPSIAAFAGLIVVVGLFALVLNRGTVNETNLAVNNPPPNAAVVNPIVYSTPTDSAETESLTPPPPPQMVRASDAKNNRTGIRVAQANFVKENNVKPNVRLIKPEIIRNSAAPPVNETLAGEDSYIKTIATLTETVKNRKDEVMKPSARFAFERDLAFADNAIETMKREIKQNPKDDAAKQILRASYQNKIDLLNSVADRTELMASIK